MYPLQSAGSALQAHARFSGPARCLVLTLHFSQFTSRRLLDALLPLCAGLHAGSMQVLDRFTAPYRKPNKDRIMYSYSQHITARRAGKRRGGTEPIARRPALTVDLYAATAKSNYPPLDASDIQSTSTRYSYILPQNYHFLLQLQPPPRRCKGKRSQIKNTKLLHKQQLQLQSGVHQGWLVEVYKYYPTPKMGSG